MNETSITKPRETMTWNCLQAHSNYVLFEGLSKLRNAPYCEFGDKYPKERGNYIISYEETPLYIGETDGFEHRLKEHYKGNTFFKNYKENGVKLNLPSDLTMDHFTNQHHFVALGRKDLEEFGIVNLPAPLNKFQKNKREEFCPESSTQLWDHIQAMDAELLDQGEKTLFALPPMSWKQAVIQPGPGIYSIFDPDDQLIYIGESTNVLDRYNTHSTKTRFSAFRRNVATGVFSFSLKTKSELGFKSSDSKRNFVTKREDEELNQYISKCRIITMPVYFGRLELEEQLIKSNRHLLNRKGNK